MYEFLITYIFDTLPGNSTARDATFADPRARGGLSAQ